MTKALQAVIFDLDGVLIDSEVCYINKLAQWVAADFHKTVPMEALLPIVGASGMEHWLAVKPFLPPEWGREEYLKAYRAFLAKHPIHYDRLPFPDTLPTLRLLREEGCRLALATSSPRDKVDQILEECGFSSLFEVTLTRDDVELRKPHPEIYLKSLASLGLSPEQCLVVEDSTIGITAAKAAGIPVAARREERYPMDQSQADYLLNRIGELPRLVRSLR